MAIDTWIRISPPASKADGSKGTRIQSLASCDAESVVGLVSVRPRVDRRERDRLLRRRQATGAQRDSHCARGNPYATGTRPNSNAWSRPIPASAICCNAC